jgi:hypothetical protein
MAFALDYSCRRVRAITLWRSGESPMSEDARELAGSGH